MPKLYMCRGGGCGIKDKCLRYTETPDDDQKYYTYPPNYNDGLECDFFCDPSNKRKRSGGYWRTERGRMVNMDYANRDGTTRSKQVSVTVSLEMWTEIQVKMRRSGFTSPPEMFRVAMRQFLNKNKPTTSGGSPANAKEEKGM